MIIELRANTEFKKITLDVILSDILDRLITFGGRRPSLTDLGEQRDAKEKIKQLNTWGYIKIGSKNDRYSDYVVQKLWQLINDRYTKLAGELDPGKMNMLKDLKEMKDEIIKVL